MYFHLRVNAGYKNGTMSKCVCVRVRMCVACFCAQAHACECTYVRDSIAMTKYYLVTSHAILYISCLLLLSENEGTTQYNIIVRK